MRKVRKLFKVLLVIPIGFYLIYRNDNHTVNETTESGGTSVENSFSIKNMHIADSTIERIPHAGCEKCFTNTNFMYNCSNIPSIVIKRKIGNGVAKQGYLGIYNGVRLVVKVTSSTLPSASSCLHRAFKLGANETVAACHAYPATHLLKEILMLHELHHPNIAPLLGYCVKGNIETDDITRYGIISVMEYGVPVTLKYLSSTNKTERFRHALNLAELVSYLGMSPLGSLLYSDFKMPHFYLINSSIKVSDMDSVTDLELLVTDKKPCTVGVVVDGRCVGYNAAVNLRLIYLLFYKTLLVPDIYPFEIADMIQNILYRLHQNDINVQELIQQLKNISKIYDLKQTENI